MNAKEAVTACSLVYDDQSFQKICELLKCETFHTFEDDDTCAVYANNADAQYLIFRGTFSGAGWILDIDFIPTKFDEFPGKVHRGFGLGWRDFEKWFKELYVPKTTMYATGHSLGGAFATLAAMRYPIEHTYTFGCPRVGDTTFAMNYPYIVSNDGRNSFKCQTRYVHDLDPVPHVPFGTFKHVTDETRIGSGWFSALWQHLQLGWQKAILASLEDHNIDQYVKAV